MHQGDGSQENRITDCDVCIITIMEICKTPTVRFKALKKQNIPHILYIQMENVIINIYCRMTQSL